MMSGVLLVRMIHNTCTEAGANSSEQSSSARQVFLFLGSCSSGFTRESPRHLVAVLTGADEAAHTI